MLTKEVRYIFTLLVNNETVTLEFSPREVKQLQILGQIVHEGACLCPRAKINAIKLARLTVNALDPEAIRGTLLNAKRVVEWFAENHRSVDVHEKGDNVPKNLGDLLKSYLEKDPGMGDPDE